MKRIFIVMLLFALTTSVFAYDNMIRIGAGWGLHWAMYDMKESGGRTNKTSDLDHGINVTLAYNGFFNQSFGFYAQANLLMLLWGGNFSDLAANVKNDFSNVLSFQVGPSFRVNSSIINLGVHYAQKRVAYEMADLKTKVGLSYGEFGVHFGSHATMPIGKSVYLLFGGDILFAFVPVGDVVVMGKVGGQSGSRRILASDFFDNYMSLGVTANLGIAFKF